MTTPITSSSIASNLAGVRERIAAACARSGRDPATVTLIAVTKTWPAETVAEVIAAGATDLGENRVQEAVAKASEVELATRPSGGTAEGNLASPKWHLIGHLQTNKVRDALGVFRYIHSVDSEKLLLAISKAAVTPVNVFLEVNVAGEESKFGLRADEVPAMVALARSLHDIRLTGLMTVAPRVANPEEVRPVFRRLAQLAREHALPHLSMGMTEDFEIAIEEGATHVRVGRAIFGERQ